MVSFAFAIGGLGGAFGMGIAAYLAISSRQAGVARDASVVVFVFWQVFPIMATAFTNNPDSSGLLRFPLGYGTYFLVRIVYGAFDLATALGSLWSFGILVGVGACKTGTAALDTAGAAGVRRFQSLVNADDVRLGGALAGAAPHARGHGHSVCLLMLSFQLIGPLIQHFEGRSGLLRNYRCTGYVDVLSPAQSLLPPGLAADGHRASCVFRDL